MNTISAIILSVLGFAVLTCSIAVVGAGMGLITIPWLTFTSKIQMNRDIVEKTYDADNAIYNYHWFQQTSEDIKATDKKIVEAQSALTNFEQSAGERKDWSFEDKTEDSRLRSVLQGLKSYYNDLVANYNARAKEVDRAIFKDELPLFFDLAQ